MNQYIKSCNIDYMRLTLKIDDQAHQKQVKENLLVLSKQLAESTSTPLSQVLLTRAGYDYFLRLPLFSEFNYATSNEETPHMLVKCSHKASDRRFIAFELKGHKYSKGEWHCVRLFMEQILSAELYEEYWDKLTVSNVDIAIGSDLPISQLLFDKLMARKAGIYFDSNGDTESVYFQPKNRSQEIAVYSRLAKAKNRGLNIEVQENTRVELRLGKMQVPLNDFINNHDYLLKFENIKSYNFGRIKDSSILGKYELMAIHAMGLTPFLRKHVKEERSKIRGAIKPYQVPVIDLKNINRLWLKQVDKLEVMDPFNKLPKSKQRYYKSKLNTMYLS